VTIGLELAPGSCSQTGIPI